MSRLNKEIFECVSNYICVWHGVILADPEEYDIWISQSKIEQENKKSWRLAFKLVQ